MAMMLHVLGFADSGEDQMPRDLILAPGLGPHFEQEPIIQQPESPSGFLRATLALELTESAEDGQGSFRLEFYNSYSAILHSTMLVLLSNSLLLGIFLTPPVLTAQLL